MTRIIDADALLVKIDEERKYLIARGQTGAEHILVKNFRDLVEDAPTVNTEKSSEVEPVGNSDKLPEVKGDLISREALKEHKFVSIDCMLKANADAHYDIYKQGWNDAIDAIIDNAPTVESPKGHWVRYRDNPHQPEHIKCSECGQYWSIADHDKVFKKCFNCGADMRGEE